MHSSLIKLRLLGKLLSIRIYEASRDAQNIICFLLWILNHAFHIFIGWLYIQESLWNNEER